jgi:hypothetical protein
MPIRVLQKINISVTPTLKIHSITRIDYLLRASILHANNLLLQYNKKLACLLMTNKYLFNISVKHLKCKQIYESSILQPRRGESPGVKRRCILDTAKTVLCFKRVPR